MLMFPEKFELALRYGENQMGQDVEMSDSDRLLFDALSKQATIGPCNEPRPSMFDPEGAGHHGPEGIAAFYDTVIGPNQGVAFSIDASYACGDEVANVGTITTTLPDGTRAIVDGVYTYRVDPEGRIAALRAFWEADAIRFEPPTG